MSAAAPSAADRSAVLERVKTLMRRDLKLGDDIVIDQTTPFAGGDADMDSLDILMILSSVEREFAIKITSEEMGQRIFQNVGTLVDHLVSQLDGKPASAANPAAAAAGQDLLQHLPHQPPFRFVSRLSAVDHGRSAEGIWSVLGNEDFLAGHFPGQPLVPGVLIAEALAQLSGLAANVPKAPGRLAKVDVRFDAAVVPPADILLSSRLARQVGSLMEYEVQASCRQAVVASGTVTLSWGGGER